MHINILAYLNLFPLFKYDKLSKNISKINSKTSLIRHQMSL